MVEIALDTTTIARKDTGDHSIPELERRLSRLVAERQRLREFRSSPFVLERNRREIVSVQQTLSRALVARFGARAA
jgi:hypothetical protein